jgi:hypothetical protein
MRAEAEQQTKQSSGRLTAEEKRLEEASERARHWKRWGPYLAERAWGTVREDYSAESLLHF